MFRLYRSAIHVLARNHYLCLDTIDGTALLGSGGAVPLLLHIEIRDGSNNH